MLIRFMSELFSSFSNAVLNPSLLSDKIIRPSAHRRDPMGKPSFSYGGGGGERGLVSLELNKSGKSLSYKLNKVGLRLSPCFTPMLIWKEFVILLPIFMHTSWFWYILSIILKMLPQIPRLQSFAISLFLSILSKALSKSTKHANNFLPDLSFSWTKECKMMRLSLVLLPLKNQFVSLQVHSSEWNISKAFHLRF